MVAVLRVYCGALHRIATRRSHNGGRSAAALCSGDGALNASLAHCGYCLQRIMNRVGTVCDPAGCGEAQAAGWEGSRLQLSSLKGLEALQSEYAGRARACRAHTLGGGGEVTQFNLRSVAAMPCKALASWQMHRGCKWQRRIAGWHSFWLQIRRGRRSISPLWLLMRMPPVLDDSLLQWGNCCTLQMAYELLSQESCCTHVMMGRPCGSGGGGGG